MKIEIPMKTKQKKPKTQLLFQKTVWISEWMSERNNELLARTKSVLRTAVKKILNDFLVTVKWYFTIYDIQKKKQKKKLKNDENKSKNKIKRNFIKDRTKERN